MLFVSKQVSLPKISLILQKMKIGQKFDNTPFLHEGLQIIIVSIIKFWNLIGSLCTYLSYDNFCNWITVIGHLHHLHIKNIEQPTADMLQF